MYCYIFLHHKQCREFYNLNLMVFTLDKSRVFFQLLKFSCHSYNFPKQATIEIWPLDKILIGLLVNNLKKNKLQKIVVGYKGLFIVVTKGRDQSFSCIVIGGKVGAGPSSLYTVKSDQGLQWMKK
jgi:hypothetical protein